MPPVVAEIRVEAAIGPHANEGAVTAPQEPRATLLMTEVSHNLQGQRLGEKGRKTRERVLAAALRMLEAPLDSPLTLSAVAREASVGMTTLYLYFPDMGDLLLAAVDQVMSLAAREFGYHLRERWPDEELQDICLDFLRAHYRFWQSRYRIIQMSNSLAEGGDARFIRYRYQAAKPLIDLLNLQMDCPPGEPNTRCVSFSLLLLAGLERVATLGATPMFIRSEGANCANEVLVFIDEMMNAEAEVAALIIRRQRDLVAAS